MNGKARKIQQLVAAVAFAFMLIGIGAHHAGATEMDKGAFKSGCESGGGSFVENANGPFQCNLKSGGTIKCPDTKSQCTYTAKLATDGGGGTVSGGKGAYVGRADLVFVSGTFDAGSADATTPVKTTRAANSGLLKHRDR